MSKNRIILAAAGGIIAVAAVVAAFFAYLSFAEMVEAEEGGEAAEGRAYFVEKARGLMLGGRRNDSSKPHVYPCAESVKALDRNAEKVSGWLKSVRTYAAAGDRVYEKTTPAAFKTFIVADAKRLVSLPGGVSGAIARADFGFGPFETYISGGKMPEEQQLQELQRRWDDVATVVEMMATNGVTEVLGVQFKTEEKKPEAEADNPMARRNAAKKRNKAAKDRAVPSTPTAAQSYVFMFSARPPALVRLVNAFATSERFITVEDFSFVREKDVVAEALAGDDKKTEAVQSAGRRRRRGGAALPAAEEKKEESAGGIVTDPLLDAPLNVALTLTVHDFRSLEDTEKTEEEQK